MTRAKRLLLIGVLLVVNGIGLVVTFVGPWPAYRERDMASERYYRDAQAAIDGRIAELMADERRADDEEARVFRAGWAKADTTPPLGTPLAGYGSRGSEPSTGVDAPLYVRALAVGHGPHRAVVLAADMLIVPPNLAETVRERLAATTGLSPHEILFNASHTHSGPGGFAPGLITRLFAGEYDPTVVDFLTEQFVEAAREALADKSPARLAHGRVEVSEWIRNRVREGPVDTGLHYLVIARDDGSRCVVARYSAHATVLSSGNMAFSGDYPGFFERAIEERTGAFGIFLAGAMGSMAPRTPEGEDGFARARALGDGLAARIEVEWDTLVFTGQVPVAAVGIPFDLPPLQFRVHPRWRLSPALFHITGLAHPGWIHGLRLGDVLLYGTPADFSGEIAIGLEAWAAEQGWSFWTLSFNGAYLGYVSPDRYYADASPRGREAYEMYVMSWLGPNQEALFTGLGRHMATGLMETIE